MGRNIGSGRGSIYKRGDKWRGQISIEGHRYSFTSEKKKEVIKWMSDIQSDANRGIIIDTNNYTVEEWMEIYFEKRVKPKVSENTYYNHHNCIKSHLYPILGNIPIRELDTQTIQDAYPKMFESKKSKKYKRSNYCEGTVKMFSQRFRAGLDYAVEQGVIRKNPHYDVILPKMDKGKRVEAYDEDEQRIIVEHCRNATDIDRVYYFLIATGLRVGECISLTWDDVNLKKSYVYVNKTAVNYRGTMIVRDHPKTEQSVRVVYIANNTKLFLEAMKALQISKESDNRRNLVFPNNQGNIYHTSALRSRWIKLCAELNIPYKGMHALRHSWATRAFEKHIEVQTVSKMLGHKSVATTMDIYQSVFAEHKIKAAQIMNSVV